MCVNSIFLPSIFVSYCFVCYPLDITPDLFCLCIDLNTFRYHISMSFLYAYPTKRTESEQSVCKNMRIKTKHVFKRNNYRVIDIIYIVYILYFNNRIS